MKTRTAATPRFKPVPAPAPVETNPATLLDVTAMRPEAAVAALVDHAVGLKASDLFFVSNEQHVAALVRHLGIVRPIAILSSEQGKKCLAHLRASAGLDVTEKRKPIDGRWILDGAHGPIDLRINTIPTLYGEDMAIRLLSRAGHAMPLEDLGMTGEQLDAFRSMIASPSGLILISGPTGSGKTATLYSTLLQLNDGRRKINTIEDPVEYAIDGLRQSQVNPAIDLGFAELLRSVLRQSPDVIMVGEVRDEETARTAVRAANSGLLVFATVHAASAVATIQSMRALDSHPRLLSTALRGVVSQRLVRTLCPGCRTSFDLSDSPETFEELRPFLKAGEGATLCAAAGCAACGHTGYSARSGVFEVMPVDRELRQLIGGSAPLAKIRKAAIGKRMLEMRHAAMLKVARGTTSVEEVLRIIPGDEILNP